MWRYRFTYSSCEVRPVITALPWISDRDLVDAYEERHIGSRARSNQVTPPASMVVEA